MGRLLKRIQKPKVRKKKISLLLTEQTLEKIEELMGLIGYENKSEFVERLLGFALEELEKELKRSKTASKKEEEKEEKQEKLIAPEVMDRI